MMKYKLRCERDHEFEGWFRSSADFDAQAESGDLECPICGSTDVHKAIMAPNVARSGGDSREARLGEVRKSIMEAAARARDYVEKHFEHVGERFPEEARKIHYGEAEPRGIYGEATGEQVKALVEEGVKIAPMPGVAPREKIAGAPKPKGKSGKKALN
ncbi:MAG: DUF1178 family protein [Alphaproteobacteria bacterium]|nr:DUF1178 family protein [Alphaproteobacteria bacterium]